MCFAPFKGTEVVLDIFDDVIFVTCRDDEGVVAAVKGFIPEVKCGALPDRMVPSTLSPLAAFFQAQMLKLSISIRLTWKPTQLPLGICALHFVSRLMSLQHDMHPQTLAEPPLWEDTC